VLRVGASDSVIFQSWTFLAFFLVVYPGWLLLKRTRLARLWLLASSYVFYALWSPLYLVLITWSALVDWLVALAMAKYGRKKRWLCISLLNNLGLLGFFKYAGFVADNVNALLGWLGAGYTISAPGWLLPVGISFYVFQSLGYVIDCYRGTIEPERCFVCYATFVSFFPRLLAGPIERAGTLLPQVIAPPRVSRQDVADGVSLFVAGLFKKVALADYLALYVNKVYGSPDQYQSAALILATLAYTWQIYFDFSGYTDMARGIARMMGIRLMLNFNNPYLATGFGEFWSRWHISLSSWFKDYVYIPLGGNKKGTIRTYVNMAATMVISGLWHGAAWTFVIWGALHALGRIVTREFERSAFYRDRVPRIAKQLFVFLFVAFAWIFFRAPTFADAWTIVTRIFTTGWADPGCPLFALVLIFGAWAYQFVYESRLKWLVELAPVRVGMVILMLVYLAVFAGADTQGFIYQQF
jgi:alginate O-acetyltransferase complex protein AlgI